MLDPQRNLLTVILIGAVVLTGVVGAAMAFVLGRVNVDQIEPAGNTEVEHVQADVPETGLTEFDQYTTIMERPVFFSDRRLPVVEIAGDDEESEPAEIEEVEEISELKAAVAGIVITPEMKLAMVSDETAGKTVVLREGMSLEGEQAAWKLETILPRAVSFVSVDGRQTQLELQVNTEGLTVDTPAPSRRRQAQAETEGGESRPEEPGAGEESRASEEARARAEEIRQRVAERRAQLRAEAERRARQQEGQDNDG